MLVIDYYNTDLVITFDFAKLGLFLLHLVKSCAVLIKFIFRQFQHTQREVNTECPDYCPRHRMGIRIPRRQNGCRFRSQRNYMPSRDTSPELNLGEIFQSD